MTTTSIPAPLTVRSLLLDEAANGADLLARAIDEDTMAAALPQLSRAGRSAAGAELTDLAKGLLELDLGGLALAGWAKHRDLVAAATRTSEHPGSTELVELATHRITSVHRPSVDLLVDGVRVAVVRLELEVELLVRALVATVRLGHLIGLRSGRSTSPSPWPWAAGRWPPTAPAWRRPCSCGSATASRCRCVSGRRPASLL